MQRDETAATRRRFALPNMAALVVLVLCAGLPHPATVRAQANQFGGQERADAAQRMVGLAVQQGINSLPPTSGQAFAYEYTPGSDIPVRTKELGPTALRATETIGASHLSFRVATSYFELADSFGPITYFIEPRDPSLAAPRGYGRVGLDASAHVGLINLSGNYGLSSRIEATFNLPIVIVDANASQSFTTRASDLGSLPKSALFTGAATVAGLDSLLENHQLVYRKESFRSLGFSFNDGTHTGIGRISLGAKGLLFTSSRLRLALAADLFLPSPHEDRLAGSASVAVLPRAIVAVPLGSRLRLHMDAGYDYDFDNAELSRFTWSSGASFAITPWATVDGGLGGSEFNRAIQWTPAVAHGQQTDQFPATILTAQAGNRLGDSFLDFACGIKIGLTDVLALSGAVTVPVNDQGFRPAALGTIALEALL